MSQSVEKTVVVARNAQDLEPFRAFFDRVHRHAAADIDNLTGGTDGSRPHVLILKDGPEPVAMIVGRIGETVMDWNIGYLRLGGSKVRLFRTVTGGLLGDFENKRDCELLCDALISSLDRGEADMAQIVDVTAGSPLHQTLQSRPTFVRRDHFVDVEPHWLLALPKSYEAFYRSRSSNTKNVMRQYRNRIATKFGAGVLVRLFKDPGDIARAMDDIENIAAKTYQRGIRVGFEHTTAVTEKFQHAAARGWLRAYVLYLDDKPTAFWSGYVYRGTFISEYTGFDPEFSYYHPGMFILLKMIEDFCAAGDVNTIDFGTGEADYKRKFSTESRQESTIHIFAATTTGSKLALLRNGTILAKRSAKKLLGSAGVADRLKKLWRKRAASSSPPRE
jgi:hypothetical protein